MTRDPLDITPLRSIAPVCCNGNCNQGRACPLRERRPPDGTGVILGVAGGLLLMLALALVLSVW